MRKTLRVLLLCSWTLIWIKTLGCGGLVHSAFSGRLLHNRAVPLNLVLDAHHEAAQVSRQLSAPSVFTNPNLPLHGRSSLHSTDAKQVLLLKRTTPAKDKKVKVDTVSRKSSLETQRSGRAIGKTVASTSMGGQGVRHRPGIIKAEIQPSIPSIRSGVSSSSIKPLLTKPSKPSNPSEGLQAKKKSDKAPPSWSKRARKPGSYFRRPSSPRLERQRPMTPLPSIPEGTSLPEAAFHPPEIQGIIKNKPPPQLPATALSAKEWQLELNPPSQPPVGIAVASSSQPESRPRKFDMFAGGTGGPREAMKIDFTPFSLKGLEPFDQSTAPAQMSSSCVNCVISK